MKINKVTITIENVDEENAAVRLTTDPVPQDNEEIEDTPAVLLGSAIWEVVQEFLEEETSSNETMRGTLQ